MLAPALFLAGLVAIFIAAGLASSRRSFAALIIATALWCAGLILFLDSLKGVTP